MKIVVIVLGVLAALQLAMANSDCTCKVPCSCESPCTCGVTSPVTSTAPKNSFNAGIYEVCHDHPFATLNHTADDIAKNSPLVALILGKIDLNLGLDSQCSTLFKLPNNQYYFFYTSTKLDGSTYTQAFFFKQAPQGPGAYEFVGIAGNKTGFPLVLFGYVLSSTCAGSDLLYNAVNRYVVQGCNQVRAEFTNAITFSNNPKPEPCAVEHAKRILETYLGNGSVIVTPRNHPVKCVASFYGQPVINADRLYNNPNIEPISYP